MPEARRGKFISQTSWFLSFPPVREEKSSGINDMLIAFVNRASSTVSSGETAMIPVQRVSLEVYSGLQPLP